MIQPQLSMHFLPGNNEVEVTVEGFERATAVLSSKKIADLNFFSRLHIWLSEKLFGKSFVLLQVDDQPTLVKIDELKQMLDVSKEKILEAEKSGSMEDLIMTASEAYHYHVEYEEIARYKQKGALDELRTLEQLADRYDLPLAEFLIAGRQGELEKLIQEAEEIEEKCTRACNQLDQMYQQSEGKWYTKNQQGATGSFMTKGELDHLKKIIRSAYKVLARYPNSQKGEIEQVMRINREYSMLVRSTPTEFKITSLFGKLLGHGGLGAAVQTLDLLEGSWSVGESSVLKIPMELDGNSAPLSQEAAILKKIHAEGNVLGIQKPLRLVHDSFYGQARHGHLGARYDRDLAAIIFDEGSMKSLKKLNRADKISIAYQLLHGLAYLHDLKITSGDIKAENVFCNLDQNPLLNEGPLAFLADFGGAIDHTQEEVPFQETFTGKYRPDEDVQASKEAYDRKDRAAYFEIEKKADIYALACTLGLLFTGKHPCDQEGRVLPGMREALLQQGFSQKTVRLFLSALDLNYRHRPRADTLLKEFKSHFALVDYRRCEHFKRLSRSLA